MKSIKKRLLGLGYLLLTATMALHAQSITIQFNATIYGQSLEGLSFVQLFNNYQQDMIGSLTISVRELKAGNVVTVRVPPFSLHRGNNIVDKAAFTRSRFSFGNNQYGQTLNQSGRFLEGEYEYCFQVDLSASKTPVPVPFVENCYVEQLQPLTPLLLINPVDGEQDCNKRPSFIWQPPFPLPQDSRFRFVLVEVNAKQDVVEAINFNPPLITQANIPVNQLNFPPAVQDLKEGKRYAWQVTMYSGTTVLKRSEIWTYEVKCATGPKDISGDSYREVKETEDGSFYIADKVLRFAFNNPYGAGELNYSVASVLSPGTPVKKMPRLVLQPGLNKYDIDLTNIREFKNGQEYLLMVRMANGRQLKLRFTYKKDEE